MKDDRIYLQHILECIRRIEEILTIAENSFSAVTPFKTLCREIYKYYRNPLNDSQIKSKFNTQKSNGLALQRSGMCWSMTTSVSTWKESGKLPTGTCLNSNKSSMKSLPTDGIQRQDRLVIHAFFSQINAWVENPPYRSRYQLLYEPR